MSAEARRVIQTEVWVGWESQVVNGVYPLRRFLGGSNHSAVFLSEYTAENLANAAIKLVPADTMDTEAQLVQWGAAAALSHPNLLRLLDVGRCRLSGRGYLFVVMEYAEQTLAQILPRRALSCDEVTQLLIPTLDVLAALHYNNLVHSQLKPSNFLVVDDQLKLASDTIRPTGYYPSGIIRTSPYDPPELSDGDISATGDVWGLGITLAEALTQHAPAWQDERFETASLSAAVPPDFADTVRRCLTRTPSGRPTVAELKAQYNPPRRARAISVSTHEPVVVQAPSAPEEIPPAAKSSGGGMVGLGAAAAIVILAAVWVSGRVFHGHAGSTRPTADISRVESSVIAPVPAAAGNSVRVSRDPARISGDPTGASGHPARTSVGDATIDSAGGSTAVASTPATAPPALASGTVLHQEIPDVPRVILGKIRGHVNVAVRVLVGPSGNVVGEFFENAGPSQYFARLAGDAAGAWTFAPTEARGSRVWLLKFEFTREGATVRAVAPQ